MEVQIYRREPEEAEMLPASDTERMKLLATEAEKTAHMINANLAEKAGFGRQAQRYTRQATIAERRLQPAPQFPEVRFNELMIWMQFLPVEHWDSAFEDYEGVVPQEVMRVIKECRERKTFDGMEIRTDTDYNSQHHALFGITNDGSCTKRYLVAKWCEDRLVSFKEICMILSARKTNEARLKRCSSRIFFALFLVSLGVCAFAGYKESYNWMTFLGFLTVVFTIASVCNKVGYLNAMKEAKKLEAFAAALQ